MLILFILNLHLFCYFSDWYLSEAEIKVDNQFCNYVEVARKIIDIKCSKILFGRTIEITKKKGRLNICEVEVLRK